MKFFATLLLHFIFLDGTAQGGDAVSISQSLFVPAEKNVTYKIGDRNIKLTSLQYGDVKNIFCINLHDNEGTSVQAAKEVLQTTGGTLWKIENNKQRVIRFRLYGITYGFDPNRMFSRIGIEQTLRDNRKTNKLAVDEIEKFGKFVLSLFPDSLACIVALHNNTEGLFSIESYLPKGNRQKDARAVYRDSLQDIDDIVLTTDSLLYFRMADMRYNSIWQDNERAKKDGSLSIYCGERKLRYMNIETQHGRTQEYINMLSVLIGILEKEKLDTDQFDGKMERL